MVEAYYNYAFHNEAIVCTAETLQIFTQTVGAEVLWAFAVVALCTENGRKYRCCVLGPGRSEMSQCSRQYLQCMWGWKLFVFCFVFRIVHPFYCGQVNVSDLRAFKLDMLLRALLYF